MKRLIFILLSFISITAFAQNPTSIYWLRSRVTDTTTVTKTAGYGALYFDVGRNKWRYYVGTTGYDFGAGGGGGATYTAGSGLTLSGSEFKWGGAITENTTLSGSGFNVTYGSSGTRLGNFRVWSNGTVGLDGSTTSFLQTGTNVVSTTTSGVAVVTTGPLLLNTDPGVAGQSIVSNGAGAPTWQNPKLASIDKTASFVAAIAEAGIYHYNITPASATTITFPSLSGQEGLQWAFWKNVDADAVVFNFGAETYNGATVLPDTSWVYVNWSDGRFKVAGTNPATGGGVSGTIESVVAGNLIDVDATDPANPIIAVETGDKGDITLGSNTLTIDNNAVTNAKINDVSVGKITGTLPVTNGGLGIATLTAYAPVFGGTTSTGPVQSGTVGTAGQILTSNGAGVLPTFQAQPCAAGGSALTASSDTPIRIIATGSPSTALLTPANLAISIVAAIPPLYGGLGLTTISQGGIPYATATDTYGVLAKNTNSTRYISNTGTLNAPAWAQIDLTNGVTGDLPFANLVQGSARSVAIVAGNATADFAAVQATANQVLRGNTAGTGLGFGDIQTSIIAGTATNDAASAGYIGESFRSNVSTYTNYTTTATYQNIASITLSAGDYEISAQYTLSSNGATITAAADAIFVISTTTASAAGVVEGESISYVPQAALLGTSHDSGSIAPYRVSLSGSTTYYLNTQATFTIGNPQFVGTIHARRVR